MRHFSLISLSFFKKKKFLILSVCGLKVCLLFLYFVISNGNMTERSPIQSVSKRVINKMGRPRSGSLICLITRMVTDRIGLYEVLLPIDHNLNKICDI